MTVPSTGTPISVEVWNVDPDQVALLDVATRRSLIAWVVEASRIPNRSGDELKDDILIAEELARRGRKEFDRRQASRAREKGLDPGDLTDDELSDCVSLAEDLARRSRAEYNELYCLENLDIRFPERDREALFRYTHHCEIIQFTSLPRRTLLETQLDRDRSDERLAKVGQRAADIIAARQTAGPSGFGR